MPILEAIAGAVGGKLVEAVFGNIRGALADYQNRKISEAELFVQLKNGMFKAFSDVDRTSAATLAQTTIAFYGAMKDSKIMQRTWAIVALSQLFVVFWYQFMVSLLITMGLIEKWPSPGDTVTWALALVVLCLGGGEISRRILPGSEKLKTQIKELAAKEKAP